MSGEELSGPPAQKVTRLLYFMGAGVICAFAINKWREYESKTALQNEKLHDSQSNAVQEISK